MEKCRILFFSYFFFRIIFICSAQCNENGSWSEISTINKISDSNECLKKILGFKTNFDKKTCQNDSIKAKIMHIIGRSYMRLDSTQKALKYTNGAVAINSKNSSTANKVHLAFSFQNLAIIYQWQLFDFTSALRNYDLSINLLKKHKTRDDIIATNYQNKAHLFYITGDYQNCIQNVDQAIEFCKNNPEIEIASITEKIQAYISLNNKKKAEEFLVSAIEKSKNIGLAQSLEIANLYSLFGLLKEIQNDYQTSIKFYSKALQINRLINYEYGVSQVLGDLAVVNIKLNRYSFGESLINESLKITKKYPLLNLTNYKYLAHLNLKKNLFQNCLVQLQKGLSEYFINKLLLLNNRENPSFLSLKISAEKDLVYEILRLKAETWLAYYHHTNKKEYLQNALETFAVADKMVDYMRREHVGYQSKLFWRDKTHSLYQNAIEVCYLLKNYEQKSKDNALNKKNKTLFQGSGENSNWDEKAFYFFEKSRAVLLNDKINNLSANQLLSESDQLKERGFQQEISELNSKIESETVEAKKSQWNVKMLDIQESQQKFIGGLAVKYPSYFAFKYDTSMYNLGQLRQYLKKSNTSFIEYFKGDSANYQLVIKPTGVNIIKQKPSENSYQYLINAADLGKRIIVSQDGEFVPLDTLKNAKGEILLNKYAFSNTYSAQYLLRNAEIKVTNSWLNSFIGFAPVNYSKAMALPSLLGADVALGNVSSNYFWPKNYENEKATKSNFAKNASDYKIIQLFTHADADNASKEPTIFFADSAMKVSELESFSKFNTELLVLSACKTNVGKVAKGEGTLSMAREFAGLGIPASVTTLWSVENAATYQITELFYKYLKSGEPKDIALQKAKLEYLEVNSREKQDPKYWAAFVLMGETAPIAGFDGKIIYFGAVISLLILGISVYFINRKKSNVGQIPNFTN